MARRDSLRMHALSIVLASAAGCGDDGGSTSEATTGGSESSESATSTDASAGTSTGTTADGASTGTTAGMTSTTGDGLNPCEVQQERIVAKFASCGLQVSPQDLSMCDDELEAKKACEADCTEAAPCGGLDGSNLDASLAYGDCTLACG